jgi:hypothetical protein
VCFCYLAEIHACNQINMPNWWLTSDRRLQTPIFSFASLCSTCKYIHVCMAVCCIRAATAGSCCIWAATAGSCCACIRDAHESGRRGQLSLAAQMSVSLLGLSWYAFDHHDEKNPLLNVYASSTPNLSNYSFVTHGLSAIKSHYQDINLLVTI